VIKELFPIYRKTQKFKNAGLRKFFYVSHHLRFILIILLSRLFLLIEKHIGKGIHPSIIVLLALTFTPRQHLGV